jgi:flagellar protein FlaG
MVMRVYTTLRTGVYKGLVTQMTNNEVNIGASIPAPVIQPKAAPVAPKVTVPSKSADPKDSAAAMSKVADQRKSESINEITEMASEIREAIAAINEAVKKVPTSLDFSVDEASKRFVVQVTDKNTGELIRKLPGDAVLRIARQLESMKGIVFDQKF